MCKEYGWFDREYYLFLKARGKHMLGDNHFYLHGPFLFYLKESTGKLSVSQYTSFVFMINVKNARGLSHPQEQNAQHKFFPSIYFGSTWGRSPGRE